MPSGPLVRSPKLFIKMNMHSDAVDWRESKCPGWLVYTRVSSIKKEKSGDWLEFYLHHIGRESVIFFFIPRMTGRPTVTHRHRFYYLWTRTFSVCAAAAGVVIWNWNSVWQTIERARNKYWNSPQGAQRDVEFYGMHRTLRNNQQLGDGCCCSDRVDRIVWLASKKSWLYNVWEWVHFSFQKKCVILPLIQSKFRLIY